MGKQIVNIEDQLLARVRDIVFTRKAAGEKISICSDVAEALNNQIGG